VKASPKDKAVAIEYANALSAGGGDSSHGERVLLVDCDLRRPVVHRNFHVENLKVPMLVHVATNDCDVFFREDQQMVYTLRALKPVSHFIPRARLEEHDLLAETNSAPVALLEVNIPLREEGAAQLSGLAREALMPKPASLNLRNDQIRLYGQVDDQPPGARGTGGFWHSNGSADGRCELDDKECFWARIYERLKIYGESETMLDRPVTLYNATLKNTSSWANTFLDRDHNAPKEPDDAPRQPR